jgi:hypothetical protein
MHNLPNEAIRRTLTRLAGEAPDSGTIAKAALDTWSRVSNRLEPVIGLRGVDALFNRALHITCKAHPWLAMAGIEENGSAQGAVQSAANLTGLRLRLAGREPVEAEEASYVLLMTFTVLLADLIGESLTKRLLEPVWSLPSASSDVDKR